MTYDSVGSGGGKARIKREKGPYIDYAGSDSLLKDVDYINHPDLQMFPTMAGYFIQNTIILLKPFRGYFVLPKTAMDYGEMFYLHL